MRLPFTPWSTAGVPSSQALPGFLITAPPSVLVPAVLGALAVWILNQKQTSVAGFAGVPSSQALLGFLITAPPSVLVPAVLGVLVVWIQNQKKRLFSI